MNHEAYVNGTDLRFELMRGVDVLAAAVKATLGPAGHHVVLERAGGSPRLTKDGVSVARSMQLENRFEDLAVQLVKQAAQSTADEVGDGTSTTTVLAHALLREGLKHLAVGVDATQLKRGMEVAAEAALSDLRAQSVACFGPDMLLQVATLSANGDRKVGQLVADALQRVGIEGVVHIEPGRGLNSELRVIDGLPWDTGPISMRFATDIQRQRIQLDNPLVLVAFGLVDATADLVELLERVVREDVALVIAAEDFSSNALHFLTANAAHPSLRLAAIKAPGIGDRRRASLLDLAIATGTRPLDATAGDSLRQWRTADMGCALRFEADTRHAVFFGGHGSATALDHHMEGLRRVATKSDAEDERKEARERLAALSGAVASIRVGAATELEYQETLDRMDDALRAARAASLEGLLPGGGVAYVRARAAARSVTADSDGAAAGVAVLVRALAEPFLQIVGNAGIEALPELSKLEQLPAKHGLDVTRARHGDMFELGIIDATAVVSSALRHAVSVAGILLTTACAITQDGIHHAHAHQTDEPSAGVTH